MDAKNKLMQIINTFGDISKKTNSEFKLNDNRDENTNSNIINF